MLEKRQKKRCSFSGWGPIQSNLSRPRSHTKGVCRSHVNKELNKVRPPTERLVTTKLGEVHISQPWHRNSQLKIKTWRIVCLVTHFLKSGAGRRCKWWAFPISDELSEGWRRIIGGSRGGSGPFSALGQIHEDAIYNSTDCLGCFRLSDLATLLVVHGRKQ